MKQNARLQKSHPIHDKERAWRWGQEHEACAACWAYIGMFGVMLENHHIIKTGRSDEELNLLRLCRRCHKLAEGERIRDDEGNLLPHITLAIALTLKMESDIEHWRPKRLEELRHSCLPNPEPIPAFFLRERLRT